MFVAERRNGAVLREGERIQICALLGVVKETELARMPELVQGGGLKILCVQSLVGSNPTSSTFLAGRKGLVKVECVFFCHSNAC